MRHPIFQTAILLLALPALAACGGRAGDTTAPAEEPAAPIVEVAAVSTGNGHFFELSRTEVQAGWTTLRFVNRSPVEHFALLSRVPDSLGVAEYRDQIARVAQNLLDQFVMGRDPSFPDAGMEIAGWYGDVVVMGGPGFASPGEVFDTAVNLQPGTYILECYVKTPEGMFHHVLGMLEQLTVTAEPSDAPGPEGTLRIVLRNDGMVAPDTVAAGRQTVEVFFEQQQQYPNLTQNDVHVVRVDEETDLAAVGAWLDAMSPTGLVAPGAPAHFVAGTNERVAGETAWFTVDLVPGRYAWIAEVPDPAGKGMVRPFTVVE